MQHLLRLFVFVLILLGGCERIDSYQYHDPLLHLQQKEFTEKLTQLDPETTPVPSTALPVLKPVTPPLSPAFLKPVSLSMAQDLPLKDVLLTLARQADVNLVMDTTIQGNISFHGKNRRFIDVVREICQISGLRYTIVNDILRIESDVAYLKSYNIAYLALVRENKSRISIATDVFKNVEGRGGEMDNGSNNLLSGQSKNDFWSELDRNITTILMHSATSQDTKQKAHFSIHQQAGLISVFGTERQQQQIQVYLQMLEASISTQVLIEAKIVEVNLKDEFKSGINWNSLKGDFVIRSALGKISTPGPFDPRSVSPRDVFTIGGSGHHLTGLLNILQRFGTVRTLSSPRMMVMNNQSAVLKVATNQVFFRIDYDREFGFQNVREREHVSSEVQTVPIGLVMIVHPSINLQNGRIIMSLRPTISRVVNEREDPAVSIVSKQTQTSMIPEVQVREFDSVVELNSGETAVLGGLMEQRSNNDKSGVPGVSDVPWLEYLFSGKSDETAVNELVVIIKATIVQANPTVMPQALESSVSAADQQIYETFTRDMRPLNFPKR